MRSGGPAKASAAVITIAFNQLRQGLGFDEGP